MKLTPGHIDGSARADRSRRAALRTAVLFCVLTFALSSVRASLNPDIVFQLWHAKRMVLIGTGAAIFWLSISAPGDARPGWRTFRHMAMLGVPGLFALFALAVGWDLWVTGETEDLLARNLRWILLWGGYFGTGLAAWLALQYGAALAEAERQATVGATSDAGRAAPEGAFWVKTGRQTIRIAHESVEWIEAEGNYVRIHGDDGVHGLVRSTLSAIEADMNGADFLRVHRSALCRRIAIRGYRRTPSGAMRALLASGAEAPLGRSYARGVIDRHGGLGPDLAAVDDTVSRRGAEAAPV